MIFVDGFVSYWILEDHPMLGLQRHMFNEYVVQLLRVAEHPSEAHHALRGSNIHATQC